MTDVDPESVKKHCIYLPETVFMLGASMQNVPTTMAKLDEERGLSLGNIIYATSPYWVFLPGFSMAEKMVTNGEYLQFLNDPGDKPFKTFDNFPLWNKIWQGQFSLDTVVMPYETEAGKVETGQSQSSSAPAAYEYYSSCRTFPDAYLESIKYEIKRAFEANVDTRDMEIPNAEGSEEVLDRLFSFIKYSLRRALIPKSNALHVIMSQAQYNTMKSYYNKGGPQAITADSKYIRDYLARYYLRRADRELQKELLSGNAVSEAQKILERVEYLIENLSGLDDLIPLHKVLYPRCKGWQSWEGNKVSQEDSAESEDGWTVFETFDDGMSVPWDELPVTGITLYESLAYCMWLSTKLKMPVTLPSEAEYERASSWPKGEGIKGSKLVVNPAHKDLLPWQSNDKNSNDIIVGDDETEDEDYQSFRDFNSFFGDENLTFEKYYQADAQLWNDLLEDTARILDGNEKLYMLEGFGWCWTLDRLDEEERKYNRFEAPNYPRFKRAQVFLSGNSKTNKPERQVRDVMAYRPNTAPKDIFFVLKGSPEVLGGPGLTVRRYAAYPLRGYDIVGFRYVIRNKQRASARR